MFYLVRYKKTTGRFVRRDSIRSAFEHDSQTTSAVARYHTDDDAVSQQSNFGTQIVSVTQEDNRNTKRTKEKRVQIRIKRDLLSKNAHTYLPYYSHIIRQIIIKVNFCFIST